MADKPTEKAAQKAKSGVDIGLLIAGLLSLIDYAEPRIKEAMDNSEISPDEQDKLKSKIDGFRNGLGFDSPEWQSRANPDPATGSS